VINLANPLGKYCYIRYFSPSLIFIYFSARTQTRPTTT